MPLWDFPVDWANACRGRDWIKPGTRVVNNLQLGQALTGEMKLDPPIKSLFVFCTNPVSQAPETNKIVEGLAARGSVHRRRRSTSSPTRRNMPTSCCPRPWPARPRT